ncbi:hypothetical protein [Yinghuangia sp. YIM S09857]|uniref:hypothetical protein n=1 Tax=Yinghuangia sp. YIM S09857 TaxID=3436929 RepID=UPI003F53B077
MARQTEAFVRDMGDAALQIGESVLEAQQRVTDLATARWEQRQDAERTQAETEEAHYRAVGYQEVKSQDDQDVVLKAAQDVGLRMHFIMDSTAAVVNNEGAIEDMPRADLTGTDKGSGAAAGMSADVNPDVNSGRPDLKGTRPASPYASLEGKRAEAASTAFQSVADPVIVAEAAFERAAFAAEEALTRASARAENAVERADQLSREALEHIAAVTPLDDPAQAAARVRTAEHNTESGARGTPTWYRPEPTTFRPIRTVEVANASSEHKKEAAKSSRGEPVVNSAPSAATASRVNATEKGFAKTSLAARRGWDAPAPDTRRVDADPSNPWIKASSTVTTGVGQQPSASVSLSPSGAPGPRSVVSQPQAPPQAAPTRGTEVSLSKGLGDD